MDGLSRAGLKALYSDARKRAAVAAGIGAYLYTALAPVVLPIGLNDRQVRLIQRSGKADVLALTPTTEQWLRHGYEQRMSTDAVRRDLGEILAHGEPERGRGKGRPPSSPPTSRSVTRQIKPVSRGSGGRASRATISNRRATASSWSTSAGADQRDVGVRGARPTSRAALLPVGRFRGIRHRWRAGARARARRGIRARSLPPERSSGQASSANRSSTGECPRESPTGEQMDIAEVVEVADGVMTLYGVTADGRGSGCCSVRGRAVERRRSLGRRSRAGGATVLGCLSQPLMQLVA
jgi:hypothetical protein